MKYLGVKIVDAEPMCEFDFLKFSDKGKAIVSSEYINSEGYKVVYEDGYISWSPKEVFEKAYAPILESESTRKNIVVDLRTGNWSEPEEQEDKTTIRNSIAVLNETLKAFSQLIPETECREIVNKTLELVKKL